MAKHLPADLSHMLNCPDFRERSRLERFVNIFRDTSVTFTEKEDGSDHERESIIRRIFGRRR